MRTLKASSRTAKLRYRLGVAAVAFLGFIYLFWNVTGGGRSADDMADFREMTAAAKSERRNNEREIVFTETDEAFSDAGPRSDLGARDDSRRHQQRSHTPPTKPNSRFAEWVESFVVGRLGEHVGRSFFDPFFLHEALRDPQVFLPSPFSSSHDSPYSLPYTYKIVRGTRIKDFPFPESLNSTASQLISLKRYTSVALQRLASDSQFFRSLSERDEFSFHSPGYAASFQCTAVDALERFVDGVLTLLDQQLQLVFDTADDNLRASLRYYHQQRRGSDPLLNLLADISPSDTEDGVRGNFLKFLSESHRQSDDMGLPTHFSVAYDSPQLQNRFRGWSYFHPVLRCFTQVRECEDPDACRFVCNSDYILNFSPKKSEIVGHYLIGGGSNNNFFWEIEWIRFFESKRVRNRIAGIATNDCTLQSRDKVPVQAQGKNCSNFYDCKAARIWFPPTALTNASVPWLQSSLCLGSHPSGAITTVNKIYQSLAGVVTLHRHSHASVEGQLDFRQTLYAGWGGRQNESRPRWTIPSEDNITLLKIDVEFGEYRALAAWMVEDLVLAVKKGRKEAVTVSQLQIEIHRLPTDGTTADASISASNWWIEYLRLQLLVLGFLPVSHEKNSFGYCCFEFVFVHYRYFVRSEGWMVASRR